MELTKKTTILFSPELHRYLSDEAARRGVSLGSLIREACTERYGYVDGEDRRAAVDELASLELPVGEVSDMKRESVPEPEDIAP